MADKRKKEMEDLMNQLNNMADNDEEDFDEVAEQKKLKMRLAQEDKEMQQHMNLANKFVGNLGVMDNDDEELDYAGLDLDSPKAGNQKKAPQQQKQQQQQGKKPVSEDLFAQINNMQNNDDDEVIHDDDYKRRQAELKRDEEEFSRAGKFANAISGNTQSNNQGIVDIDNDDDPYSKQPKARSSKVNQDQIISQDEQYSSLKHLICVSQLVQEYISYDKYLKDKSLAKLVEHYTTKREKIKKNVQVFNSWILSGQMTVNQYIEKVQASIQEQMKLMKQAGQSDPIAKVIAQRVKTMQNEVDSLKKDPKNFIKKLFDFANQKLGIQQLQAQKNQQSAAQILAAAQDQLSVKEKVKLLSKFHKQNHNLTLFYKANVPEKQQAITGFYIPLLTKSQGIINQLKSGQNVTIANFLETELFEVTPELFHKCSIQEFEAQKSLWIDKLDQGIKAEHDLQKMIQNQKKLAKVKEITDTSNFRIKKYEQSRAELMKINYNQYVLFPSIQTQTISLELSLDNKNIEKNAIIINIKRLVDCKADKFRINYSFTPEQNVLSHQTELCNQSLVFSDEKKFMFQQAKCPKDLHKKKIEIIMYCKGFFSESEFARGSISLSDLETSNSIDSALILNHKGKQFSLEYGVYIRAPVSSQSSKEMQIYDIKFYPPLKVNDGVDEYIQKNVSETKVDESSQKLQPVEPQQKPNTSQSQQQQQKPQQQQEKPPSQPQQQQQKQPPAPQKEEPPQIEEEEEDIGPNPLLGKFIFKDINDPAIQKIKQFQQIPEPLSVNDLVDLENGKKYQSLLYLKAGVKMYVDAVQTNEYTSSNRMKVNKMKEKFIEYQTILEINVQNSKISPEQYQETIQKCIDDDNKLIWVYTQLNLPEWVNFVKARKELLKRDLFENFEEQYDGKPFSG